MSDKLAFLNDFTKSISDIDGIGRSSEPPRYWISFGNYVLNAIMSGSVHRGIPQGRITGLVGPSGSGKSFIVGNAVKNAQDAGNFCFVIDSENALDDEYMTKIGVDVTNNYMYRSVDAISHVIKLVSTFVKGYKKEYGDNPDAPHVFIVIDSLDMLSTDSELVHFEKGEQSSDQGLRAKQLKQMLRQFVTAIKNTNITMVVTGQVYQATAQQIMEGDGKWIVNQAIRYALSQIVLLTKLKLKQDTDVVGIRMKCEGFKTRFTQPFQTVTVEVPYSTGMDPTSGLLESGLSAGIINKKGSRYTLGDETESWYSKDMGSRVPQILDALSAMQDLRLKAILADDEEMPPDDTTSLTKQRAAKLGAAES